MLAKSEKKIGSFRPKIWVKLLHYGVNSCDTLKIDMVFEIFVLIKALSA